MEYIESIKKLRKNANITQSKMSVLLGMSERNYREKESGKLPFNQIEMIKLIKIFNLEKDELFELFYLNGLKTSFWINDSFKTIK